MGFFDNIKEGFDDFVFSLTTNDRYASSRTPYNANNLNSNSNSYRRANTFSTDNINDGQANQGGYRPGMRSRSTNDGIAMRDYGSAVPMAELWERLETKLLDEFPDLVDFLNEPATAADLNELENDINVSLPIDVRESWQIHDGQERGGKPSGVIMGITILDVESIAEEYTVWQTAARRIQQERKIYLDKLNAYKQHMAQLNSASGSSADGSKPKLSHKKIQPPVPRIDFMAHQRSFPEGTIQPVYVHSGWVPLVKDFSGNNIAIDLAPGPKGKWGQVICFGNDFDTKFVIANSWSEFMENVVKDFEAGNFYVDNDYDELSYSENGIVLNYLDVLKKRHLPPVNRHRTLPPHMAQQAARHNRAATNRPDRVFSSSSSQFPATKIGGADDAETNDASSSSAKVEMPKETLIVPEKTEPIKTETERVADNAELKFSDNESVITNEEDDEDKDDDYTETKPLKEPKIVDVDFI
ncbi:hypothetical protein DASC09_025900 [Saccharomycopsis crataegensis]|uniref:Knr4/Smi1-like domain-containing protein n=1 Tax=Saccharomycopsis crataegensis TaxID=43959 RepID=A0AAV5QL59_9ASCO|nr:hypothetical protein DASC09_025900 [Saccharomycopsis crataegensis]